MENAEVPPICDCGVVCRKCVAGTPRNRGRNFWGCHRGRAEGTCGFFRWVQQRPQLGEGSRSAAQNTQNQLERERIAVQNAQNRLERERIAALERGRIDVQNQVERERRMFMVSAVSWMLANRAIIRATILEERNREFEIERQNHIRATRMKVYYFLIFMVGFVAYNVLLH